MKFHFKKLMEKVRKLHYVWNASSLSANMWIVLKYIDFLWCPKITRDGCQNFQKRHSFVTGELLSSVLQNTVMPETAIETLNLVVWDHMLKLSVCCEIIQFSIKETTFYDKCSFFKNRYQAISYTDN